jgi:hypothetical protein
MGSSDISSWKVTQVGVVVKDVQQVAERLSFLGIGPFQEMKLPPDTGRSCSGANRRWPTPGS